MTTPVQTQLMTSLAEIRSFNPCASGWKDILAGQGKIEADEVLFPLVDCLNSNSIKDVCWLLGKRKKEIQIVVRFARMCASSVASLKYPAHAWVAAAQRHAARADTYASTSTSAGTSAVVADYAANAAHSSGHAYAYAAAHAGASAAYAYKQQIEKNKQFLVQCINEFPQA